MELIWGSPKVRDRQTVTIPTFPMLRRRPTDRRWIEHSPCACPNAHFTLTFRFIFSLEVYPSQVSRFPGINSRMPTPDTTVPAVGIRDR